MSAQITAFRAAAAVLDTVGVPWWLSDGAVLGAHRDGRFIATDPDVDLGVPIDHMGAARAAFAEAGYPLRRDRATQLWPMVSGVKIDLHGHELDVETETVFYRLGRRAEYRYVFPVKLFEDFDEVRLHGVACRVPSPVEDYLCVHYGPDWATPRPVWRWDADPPCLERT